MFHPFVLPFLLGTICLFAIILWKFTNWITTLNRKQYATGKHTLLTHLVSPAIWKMVKTIFCESLLHVNISKHNKRLGFMHRSIALGWFLLIVTGLIETIIHYGYHPRAPWIGVFYRFFVHTDNHIYISKIFATVMDLLLVYVLIGVTMAIVKSINAHSMGLRQNTRLRWSDLVLRYSLWSIFPLRLISETLTASIYHNGGIITQSLGNLINPHIASIFEVPAWGLYSLALGLFFAFMPFSRYMHIFAEPLLIILRSIGIKEDERPTGYTKAELSACSRCGMCIQGCPMSETLHVDDIQPVYLIRGLRHQLPYRFAATNCLMCNHCTSICPVGIDINAIRQQARSTKATDNHNCYDYIANKPFNAVGRVAYFGGCMSHLTPTITESMKKIFDAVGQRYWMMDEQQSICCGRPLAQQGFFNQAAELRRKNTTMIIESHCTLLVTSCPICYRSFTQEYHLPIKVMHHTEYLAMLVEQGVLKTIPSELKVAYHDPCELGRGCGIYNEPRTVIQSVATLTKVEREREESLCCGCNLGNTCIDAEQQLKVRDTALNNLIANKPDAIATACPMCKKAFQNSTTQRVYDVAELIAQQLEKQ